MFSQHLKKEKNHLNFLYYRSHAQVKMQGTGIAHINMARILKKSSEFLRRIFKDSCRILENSQEFLRHLENSFYADVYKACKFVFFTVNVIYSVEK